MLLYSIVYYLATFLISLILQLILFSGDFNLTDIYQNNYSYLAAAGLTYLGNFLVLWLLLSLVLLLANIFKTTAAAITVGIIGYFATSIISTIMFALMTKWEWLKWNPFNMLNLPNQMLNGKIYKLLTMLSTQEMVIGNLVYIAIFLGLGFLAFRRRNV
jgi:ABC-2 type transport system permease protein